MRELIVAFLALAKGVLRWLRHKFFPQKFHYQIVVYLDNNTPVIVWDDYVPETVAFSKGMDTVTQWSEERVVLRKLVSGRWEEMADTHR